MGQRIKTQYRKLLLEQLEDRTVPAVTPVSSSVLSDAGGTVSAWVELNGLFYDYDTDTKSDPQSESQVLTLSSLSSSSESNLHANVETTIGNAEISAYATSSITAVFANEYSGSVEITSNWSLDVFSSSTHARVGAYGVGANGKFIYTFMPDFSGEIIIEKSDPSISVIGDGAFGPSERTLTISAGHSTSWSVTNAETRTFTINWRIVGDTPSEPDLVAEKLEWRPLSAGGGVDFYYSIKDLPLPQAATVTFFWSESPQGPSGIPATSSRETQTQVGSNFKIIIPGAELTPAPSLDKTYYLVAVIVPATGTNEASPLNNIQNNQPYYVAHLDLDIQTVGIDSLLGLNPTKNEHYLFVANVTNQSPVPMPAFSLNWTENRTTGEKPELPQQDYPVEGAFAVPALGLGATVSLNQVFKHNWEWIPQTNPVPGLLLDSVTDIYSLIKNTILKGDKLISVLDKAKKGLDVLQQFLTALDMEQLNRFTYALTSPGSDVNVIGETQQVVDVTVSLNRNVYYLAYVGAAEAGKNAIKLGLAGLAGSKLFPPLAAAASVSLGEGIKYLGFAWAQYELAKDPPDSDFRTTVLPQPLTFDNSESGLTGFPLLSLQTQLEWMSLQLAHASAMNKADGAALAGDYEWQARQLLSASEFAHAAFKLEAKLLNQQEQLFKALQFPGGYSNYLQDAQQALTTRGLPLIATSILSQLGWNQQQVDELTTYLRESIVSLPLDASVLTLEATKTNTIFTGYSAFDLFSRAIKLRTDNLGATVLPISSEQLDALSFEQQTIEASLLNGIPSSQLQAAIETHITKVRNLYLQTNNTELSEYLDAAQSYLANFEQLDTDTDGIRTVLDKFVANGKLTLTISNQFKTYLALTDSHLSAGDFTAAGQQLSMSYSAIRSYTGDQLNQEVADDLTAYVSYIGTTYPNFTVVPPAVSYIVIANGQTQRSKVKSIQVYFDSLVSIQSGAFQLFYNNKPFTVSTFTTSEVDGKTVATLQVPSKLLKYNSLLDGKYRLVTRASKVSNASGDTMEQDHTDSFFRLFGDVNGDGRVNSIDREVFRSALGKKSSQAGYLAYLDYNGDGKIGCIDLLAFKSRYGKRV